MHVAVGHDLAEHGLEMVVFGQLVLLRGVDAEVEGQKITRLAAAVHQVDQPDAGDHAVHGARVLALGGLPADTARALRRSRAGKRPRPGSRSGRPAGW